MITLILLLLALAIFFHTISIDATEENFVYRVVMTVIGWAILIFVFIVGVI